MGMILSNIVLPNQSQSVRYPLYYRSCGQVDRTKDGLCLYGDAQVRFNTYFNGFFYTKYLTYTHVHTVDVVLTIQGESKINIFCYTGQEKSLLNSCKTSGKMREYRISVSDLEILPVGGAIVIEIKSLSDKVIFYRGKIESQTASHNEIKVAIAICTYKREEYVRRNIQRIDSEIWNKNDCVISDDVDVFVIDNGNSLVDPRMSHVQVVPNHNFGGSGGFTRGIIEAYKCGEKYSHVLLMDDDIEFEPEILLRTVQFLKFAKSMEQPLCIGGQMLIEDDPTIQFESGAFFRNGRLNAFGQGVDLSQWDNVLLNDIEQPVEYNAWWFFCFPLQEIDRIGLPLPLFIKGDDVEFSLRMQPHIVLMNGIGVWHMAFSQKYSPHLEYYIKRNEMLVSALHRNEDGRLLNLWKLIRASAKAILIAEPKAVFFLLKAYKDFFEGPDFFLHNNEELLNQSLIQEKERADNKRVSVALKFPFELFPIILKMVFCFQRIRNEYRTRLSDITSMEFWCDHLEISMPE